MIEVEAVIIILQKLHDHSPFPENTVKSTCLYHPFHFDYLFLDNLDYGS